MMGDDFFSEGLSSSKSSDKLSELGNKNKLKRSASQRELTRTNSLDNLGELLKHPKRKKARKGSSNLSAEDMEDFSVIAVYSREAFENFGRKWKSRMNSDTLERATKRSRKGVDEDEVKSRLGLQSRSEISTGFDDQIQALLENKTNPHVIAVIEGKQEQASLTLKTLVEDNSIELNYTRIKFSQGVNSLERKDEKQSMTFYVRNDMKKVYNFTDEKVTRGSEEIRAVGVNYQTIDGSNYRSLVVHIPNKYVKSDKDVAVTHQAFEDYAIAAAAESTPVIVTGYLGDTNYKKPASDGSAPSMGGILPSGDTLNPQSSSTQRDTNFMQSIPVGEDHVEHAVLQPSMLNSVFVNPNKQDREVTDHPSITSVTAHSEEILGREPAGNPSYYQLLE